MRGPLKCCPDVAFYGALVLKWIKHAEEDCGDAGLAERTDGAVKRRMESGYSLKFAPNRGTKDAADIEVNLLELLNRNIPGGIMGGYLQEGFPLFCVNDYMLKHLGFTYEEFVEDIGGMVINCMHPEDRPRIDEAVAEAFSRGDEYEVQYRMRKKDGSYIWVNDIGRKVTTDAGEAVCVSTIRDITRAMRAEQELRMREEQFRIAAVYAGNIIFQYDLTTRAIYTTEEIARRFGVASREEDIPYAAVRRGVVCADSAGEYVRLHEQMLAGADKAQGIVRLRDAEGGSRAYELTLIAVPNGVDKPVRAVGIYRDVTGEQEKERYIREIERQRALYSSLFQSAVCGIVQYKLAEDGGVTFKNANQEAIRIFGYTPEAFWQKDRWILQNLIDIRDRARIMDEIASIQKVVDKQAYEYRLLRQDGTSCWIIGTAELMRDVDDEIVMQSVFMDVDQRKRAEIENIELLRRNRASDELLRLALSGTDICDFTYFPQQRRAEIPERTRRHYRCRAVYEQMPASFAQDMTLGEGRADYDGMYARIHEGERTASAEFRIQASNRWVRVTLSTVEYDGTGKPTVTVGLVEDITRQKDVETERSELSRLNADILSSLNELFFGVYRIDLAKGTIRAIRMPEGGERVVTATAETPYRVEEVAALYHSEERMDYCREHSLQNLREKKAQGVRSFTGEYRRERGKEYGWITSTVYLNGLGAGSDIAILTLMDASEHRRQSDIIQALGREYYALYYVNMNRDRYEILRSDGAVVRCLNAGRQGCYSELIRQYVAHFVHPEERKEMETFFGLEECRQRFGTSAGEGSALYRKLQADGTYAWMQARIVLSEEEDGVPRHLTVAIRNVDENIRKELETKRLLEDALRRAESANAAKSDFLSRISHDIRTPMNAIVGMTALAGSYLGDQDRVRDCLDKIAISSRHLLGLINEVLDMSKIESGRAELDLKDFNLRRLVQDALTMIRPAAADKRQALNVEIRGVVHEDVTGDAVRLEQVLANLLSNAVKYTPEGGKIALALEEIPAKVPSIGRYVFTVEDNGIGMSEEYVAHIFEPFSRADDSRISRIAGTGLGLTITQNIVHMMGGEIGVQSHWGEGTRFTVSLGLRIAAQTEKTKGREAAKGAAPDGAQESRLDGKRVLVVEDNELNMEIATEFLKMAGATVETANDGEEAVKAFVSRAPGYYDLILMDIQMPVMNGYEAARAIRAQRRPDASSIPIVAMTADAFTADVQRAKEAGMNAHIAKPIEMDQLFAVLREVI